MRQRERRWSKLPRALASMAVIAATTLGAAAWVQPAQAQPARTQPVTGQPAHTSVGHRTVVTYSDLSFDQPLPDDRFSLYSLRQR